MSNVTNGDKVVINCLDPEDGFPYEEIGVVINDREKVVDLQTVDGRILRGVDKWLCKLIATADQT